MVAPQGHLAQRSATCTLPKLHKLSDVASWPVARVRIVQYLINTKLWLSVEGPEPVLDDLVEFYVAEGHAKAAATKLAEEGIAQHRAAAPLALDVLSNLVDWESNARLKRDFLNTYFEAKNARAFWVAICKQASTSSPEKQAALRRKLASIIFADTLTSEQLEHALDEYNITYLAIDGNRPDTDTGGYTMLLDAVSRIQRPTVVTHWNSLLYTMDAWEGRDFCDFSAALVASWAPPTSTSTPADREGGEGGLRPRQRQAREKARAVFNSVWLAAQGEAFLSVFGHGLLSAAGKHAGEGLRSERRTASAA